MWLLELDLFFNVSDGPNQINEWQLHRTHLVPLFYGYDAQFLCSNYHLGNYVIFVWVMFFHNLETAPLHKNNLLRAKKYVK